MIYADYAATTPVDPMVAQAMAPYQTERFYNPSALYPEARAVRAAVEEARAAVAAAVGAAPECLTFTSGGTEGDSLAILGTALHPDQRRRHLITSAVEHHAVLESCAWLGRHGFRVTYLPVDRYGRVDPADLKRAMTEDTFLVSIQWVNNELGTIQDIPALAETAHRGGALFHTDAVQALPTQEIRVEGVDLLTLSAHKFYGPKGCGALYLRPGTALVPMHPGGDQESGRRGGTEHTAGIVGIGAAATLLLEEGAARRKDLCRWKSLLLRSLEGVADMVVNSPHGVSAPSILHLGFAGVEAEGLLFHLGRAGVMASMGAACNTRSVEPSHVVEAIGLPEEYRRGCLRLSLGRGLDDATVEELGDAVRRAVERVRG